MMLLQAHAAVYLGGSVVIYEQSIVMSTAVTIPAAVLAQYVPSVVRQNGALAQKHVKVIGMEEYQTIVEHSGSALIIDVREPHGFVAGHIHEAINIPCGVIDAQIWNHVNAPAKADKQSPSCCNAKREGEHRWQYSRWNSWDSHIHQR